MAGAADIVEANAEKRRIMKTSLSQSHFAIVRLLARQAVQDHLTNQSQCQRGNPPERSNRPVQSAGNNK